jgi:hypothetical protein
VRAPVVLLAMGSSLYRPDGSVQRSLSWMSSIQKPNAVEVLFAGKN